MYNHDAPLTDGNTNTTFHFLSISPKFFSPIVCLLVILSHAWHVLYTDWCLQTGGLNKTLLPYVESEQHWLGCYTSMLSLQDFSHHLQE